jgi:CDP-ribitol ribitolphosphotransferase
MTHDGGEDSNVSLLVNKLKKLDGSYTFSYITKSETELVKSLKAVSKLLAFFFLKPYHMARSKVILMDNIFLPMAYIRLSRNVKVIQLWHGTGTIKKFGQDVNSGRLKEQERRANRNITHLIVNNKQTAKLYAKVFGIDIHRVYPLGLPKTDDILNRMGRMKEINIKVNKKNIYEKYNLPMDKKLILYAPTFRDINLGSDRVLKHVEELAERLPKDYILGLRLHPYVARMAKRIDKENVRDLSNERSLSELMIASDLLITDYSSIIFEYCITEKPMIFFAYDLDDFISHGRGFYNDYTSYVPGPVVKDVMEVIDIINKKDYRLEEIHTFVRNNFPNLDGKASERIIEVITNK